MSRFLVPLARSLARAAGTLAVLLLASAAGPGTTPAVPMAKIQASLTRIFGSRAVVEPLTIDGTVVYRVTGPQDTLGYACVSEAKGKDQPITFLVAIDAAGTLKDVDILVYREAYGGEVAQDAWRKQFRGKSADDRLRVGKEIRNISGATISVHAVTAGVRRILETMAGWLAQGKLP